MNLKNAKKIAGNKQIVLLGLVFIIVIAGILNWVQQNDGAQETSGYPLDYDGQPVVEVMAPVEEPKASDYFSSARLDREQSRSRALEILKETTTNSSAETEDKRNAQANINKIALAVQNEMIIENLIKAKGFQDSVVYISDSGVSVIVKAESLTPAQTAQIKDIVMEKAFVGADKIKIVSIK